MSKDYAATDLGEGALALPKMAKCANDLARNWLAKACLFWQDFNHEEAIACAERAHTADPDCAMAWYVKAQCHGTSYNFPPGLGSGLDAIAEARRAAAKDGVSALERDLIDAAATRWTQEAKDAIDPAKMAFGNTPECNQRYADAMQALLVKYPDSLDVAALTAEALMNLNPWKLWNKDAASGAVTPADENTTKIKAILEAALAKDGGAQHAPLVHLYIHLTELGPEPTAALKYADGLRTLFPACGHLCHMPSHTDVWAGQFIEGLDANVAGVAADDRVVELTGKALAFHAFYRMHNHHFIVWTAMLSAQRAVAMKYARKIEAELTPDAVQFMLGGAVPLGAVFLEAFSMNKWMTMVRFGMWDEIVAEKQYDDAALYPTGVAMGHYARGVAFAARGKLDEALAEQAAFKGARGLGNAALEGRVMHNNPMLTASGPCVLKVADAVLDGELLYRQGKYDEAFARMREAVVLDDGLNYDEPWGWMMSARGPLGALLLERGRLDDARAVFEADVKLWRDNVFGLVGLVQTLEKLGDAAADAAADAKRRLAHAARKADVELTAACYCAQAAGAAPPTGAAAAGAAAACCDAKASS